jgi:hypothetical protein
MNLSPNRRVEYEWSSGPIHAFHSPNQQGFAKNQLQGSQPLGELDTSALNPASSYSIPLYRYQKQLHPRIGNLLPPNSYLSFCSMRSYSRDGFHQASLSSCWIVGGWAGSC